MTVDHLKLLHAMGGKGYFDARALAVDYRTLGFRECVGEVVRYLSSLEGVESSDPIGARLVSHLSHCASELDPLLQSSSTLPFPPWPWPSFPQLAATSSPISSTPFPPNARRDLTPHATAAMLGYPSAALRMGSLGTQGAIMSPSLTPVRRLPSIPGHPHRLQQHSPDGHTIPSSSSSPPQISFRPFAPLGSPAPGRRGSGTSSKSAQAWGTEIGAF
ncbi:hairy/enhancer-of-split related with YRPW motif-like protein [Pimephales promelas]|nr:hairy/enhancer-of-split related with YRPW motif-like protein [Pimephales promelas]